MLHDRRKRDGKRPCQLAYGNVFTLVQLRQQRAAGWVGERGEGTVERGSLILNHMVKLFDAVDAVKGTLPAEPERLA
jgi:hypothetical protein